MCLSFHQSAQEYSFWLPTHKANTTFKGNKIVVWKISRAPDPLPIMTCSIESHDTLFPFHLQLWLKADGTTPLCSWFISCLHHYFGTHIAGQSMCSGGATAMAEAGAVPELIKGVSQWSSTAFKRYICKNPVVLHSVATAIAGVFANFTNKIGKITDKLEDVDKAKSRGVSCQH